MRFNLLFLVICTLAACSDKGAEISKLYPSLEGRAFADAHFGESDYRAVEYDLARSPQIGDSGAYEGSESDWVQEPWEVKIHFLPSQGFTHELPTEDKRRDDEPLTQQYYERIGLYIHQFGFGWDDHMGDDPGTPWFDGSSANGEFYRTNYLNP